MIITIFLIGLSSQFYVSVGSQLYPVEIVLSIVALYTVIDKSHVSIPRWMGCLLAVWLFATFMSDLVNATDFNNSLKGILRLVFLATNLYALVRLCDTREKLLAAWLGVSASGLLAFFLQPSLYTAGEPWKFGLSMPVTLAILAFLSMSKLPGRAQASVVMAYALINFSLSFRSLAYMLLATSIVQFAWKPSEDLIFSTESKRKARRRTVFVLTSILFVGVGLVSIYDNLSLAGALGEKSQVKAELQSTGAFDSFFTGRSEVPMEIFSILEKPLWGHGSFSPPSLGASSFAADLFSENGYDSVANRYSQGLFPYHSELLGVTAENGVMAGMFWIATLLFFTRFIRSLLMSENKKPPLVTFIVLTCIWDILFSPYGADRRFFLALAITTVLIYSKQDWHTAELTKKNKVERIGPYSL